MTHRHMEFLQKGSSIEKWSKRKKVKVWWFHNKQLQLFEMVESTYACRHWKELRTKEKQLVIVKYSIFHAQVDKLINRERKISQTFPIPPLLSKLVTVFEVEEDHLQVHWTYIVCRSGTHTWTGYGLFPAEEHSEKWNFLLFQCTQMWWDQWRRPLFSLLHSNRVRSTSPNGGMEHQCRKSQVGWCSLISTIQGSKNQRKYSWHYFDLEPCFLNQEFLGGWACQHDEEFRYKCFNWDVLASGRSWQGKSYKDSGRSWPGK